MTLNSFLLFHGIEGEAKWKLMECARVIYTVRDLFLHMGRVMMTMSPRNIERRRSLPESLRDVDTFRTDTENVHEHDDKRLTSFQHAFLYLRKVLEGQVGEGKEKGRRKEGGGKGKKKCIRVQIHSHTYPCFLSSRSTVVRTASSSSAS